MTSRRSCAWGSSPHTRGALRRGQHHHGEQRIIPAYAGSTFRIRTMARCRTDHPRIRGEHHLLMAPTRFWQGSSPHTRGAHIVGAGGAAAGGIIPAYAGSTNRRSTRLVSTSDHPRIRGEHGCRFSNFRHELGSSPHTRGARRSAMLAPMLRGIIPAYAGSTKMKQKGKGRAADHPRIRGEHTWSSSPFETPGGSSPHTRGAPFVSRSLHILMHGSSPHTRGAPQSGRRPPCGAGIIPAYAGSTRRLRLPDGPRRDHPRIRGEHTSRKEVRTQALGSSPHTRGALSSVPEAPPRARIIPAYAGSTRPPRSTSTLHSDHPRIRGEHLELGRGVVVAGGSSPHTRGAHLRAAEDTTKFKDHPRIRGEHNVPFFTIQDTPGSSPHTRGAHLVQPFRAGDNGIIPAYAGSTVSCRV